MHSRRLSSLSLRHTQRGPHCGLPKPQSFSTQSGLPRCDGGPSRKEKNARQPLTRHNDCQSRASKAGVDSLKRLVVTADDFGLSLPVNDAVEQAHTHGILTAASLLTGAPACDDAVERARRLPQLGVGLHLALVDGRPVLPCDQVPGLVGTNGRFSTDPVRFGTELFFSAE
jgi:hypothetical protein